MSSKTSLIGAAMWLTAILSSASLGQQSAIPPAPLVGGSDSCTTPDVIAGLGPFVFDVSSSTTGIEGQSEPLCSHGGVTTIYADVWFTWTAAFSGWAEVSTCGQTVVDTKMAAYAGTGCPTGPALDCNDNHCGNGQSVIRFAVVAGNAYTIQIGKATTSPHVPGTFTISSFTPVPVDDCQLPAVLTVPSFYHYDTTSATDSTAELSCAYAFKDLWYTYTATTNGTATFTNCGSTSHTLDDSTFLVYAGAGCPTGPPIACDTGGSNCYPFIFSSNVVWSTICGQTYTLRLGSDSPQGLSGITGYFSVSEVGTACGPVSQPYCFGDGTSEPCPCNNLGAPGNGCPHALNPNGANLSSTGTSSLSNDTLVLHGAGMSNSVCLYFQGTSPSSGSFGDGRRCVGGSLTRLGTKPNVAGASRYPDVGDAPVNVLGGVSAPGLRTYQVWYRSAAPFCTPETFNLTNGQYVIWM